MKLCCEYCVGQNLLIFTLSARATLSMTFEFDFFLLHFVFVPFLFYLRFKIETPNGEIAQNRVIPNSVGDVHGYECVFSPPLATPKTITIFLESIALIAQREAKLLFFSRNEMLCHRRWSSIPRSLFCCEARAYLPARLQSLLHCHVKFGCCLRSFRVIRTIC